MSIFDYMDEPVVVIGIIALIGAVIYLIYHIYDDVSSSNAAEKYKKEYEYRWYDQKPEFDRQYNEYCKKARLETADYIEKNFASEQSYFTIDFPYKHKKLYLGLSKDGKQLVFWWIQPVEKAWKSDFHKTMGPPSPQKTIEETSVNIDDILYFKYDENTSYTTSISGGGANFEGAVKGAVLAGATGAIIGGGARPVTSRTEKHTEKAFVIKYTDGTEKTEDEYPEKFNEVYMTLIPQKEYSFVALKAANASSAKTEQSELEDLVKLKELLDKGIITQKEFDAKKKQILGL